MLLFASALVAVGMLDVRELALNSGGRVAPAIALTTVTALAVGHMLGGLTLRRARP